MHAVMNADTKTLPLNEAICAPVYLHLPRFDVLTLPRPVRARILSIQETRVRRSEKKKTRYICVTCSETSSSDALIRTYDGIEQDDSQFLPKKLKVTEILLTRPPLVYRAGCSSYPSSTPITACGWASDATTHST